MEVLGQRGFALPVALGNKVHWKSLDVAGTGSKVVGRKTTDSPDVLVVTVDDLLHNERLTVLRLDIEGDELTALQGAEESIRKDKPVLQIAVYHRPDDLVTLMEWIAGLGIYSKYFLRTHRASFFDTFLYCYS
jgi:hypothetical protein